MEKDQDGNLPIHIACKFPFEIARKFGTTPLDDIVQFMVHKNPETLQTANKNGQLAIHCFCTSRAVPMKTLACVVSGFPEGLRVPTHFAKDLPVHLAMKNFLPSSRENSLVMADQFPEFEKCDESSLENILFLVDRFPGCLQIPNRHGQLAIDIAMDSNRNHPRLECVQRLFLRHPDVVFPLCSGSSDDGNIPEKNPSFLHWCFSRPMFLNDFIRDVPNSVDLFDNLLRSHPQVLHGDRRQRILKRLDYRIGMTERELLTVRTSFWRKQQVLLTLQFWQDFQDMIQRPLQENYDRYNSDR